MLRRFLVAAGVCTLAAGAYAGCGGSPITPQPPPPIVQPPVNAAPNIESITVQGRRRRQPAAVADIRETVDVSATVRDSETPVEQLVYQWTASVGTFTGTGRAVTWTAPDSVDKSIREPLTVTITLKVIEHYGHPGQAPAWSHEVTATTSVRLHDSVREIGDMSRLFLDKFSQPQTIRDWREVMSDFDLDGGTCPDPRQVDAEKDDVIRHYTHFVMHRYEIGAANVSVDFGEGCHVPLRGWRPGDACVRVPVFWDSTDTRDNTRGISTGTDWISAAYSVPKSRWFLCSSDFPPSNTLGHSFYAR
ncbi:MAG TPA: hypothetical protein VM364_02065 [Vicinamibacterales bacterium]|nr:hypothetical protein [Vicinamibacterales bacterium]